MKSLSYAEEQAEFYDRETVPTVELTRTTLRDALAEAFARDDFARIPGAKHYRRADLALDTIAAFAPEGD